MRSVPLLVVLTGMALQAQPHLVEGKQDSPVRVVIYEDLQCSDCAEFRAMLDTRLLPEYEAKVAFEHRDFPLPKHKWARPAAIAARYFFNRNAALAVLWRQETMRAQAQITPENFGAHLAAFAKRNGVDPAAVEAALTDATLAEIVQKDYEEGVARGIAHTPTALVNGAPFIETFTFEEIAAAIGAALKENGIE